MNGKLFSTFTCLFLSGLLLVLPAMATRDAGSSTNEIINVTVMEKRTAILPCSASSNGQRMVSWMNPNRVALTIADRRIFNDARFSVVGLSRNLQIINVRVSDAGVYTCNSDESHQSQVNLQVSTMTRFVDDDVSTIIDVNEGEDVGFDCHVTGFPAPVVNWSFQPENEENGGQKTGKENEWKAVGSGHLFRITSVSRHSAGKYTCVAYNGNPPPVSREFQLVILFPPTILEVKLKERPGYKPVLQCTVLSHPQSNISWKKDGYKIEQSADYAIDLSLQGKQKAISTLKIFAPMENIGGNHIYNYTCESKNILGMAMQKFYLSRNVTSAGTSSTPRTDVYTTAVSNHGNQVSTVSNEGENKQGEDHSADGAICVLHIPRLCLLSFAIIAIML